MIALVAAHDGNEAYPPTRLCGHCASSQTGNVGGGALKGCAKLATVQHMVRWLYARVYKARARCLWAQRGGQITQ